MKQEDADGVAHKILIYQRLYGHVDGLHDEIKNVGSECDTNAATPALALCIAALKARGAAR